MPIFCIYVYLKNKISDFLFKIVFLSAPYVRNFEAGHYGCAICSYALLQCGLFTFLNTIIMNHSVSWSSKLGFVLAAAGSAIGLGAIWKFPYTAGTNGGAVFFLLFLLFTILVALPVQLAEFYIGRTGGKNAIDSFKTLRPGSQWPWVGRMGVAACFILLSFYSVVGGWVLNYVCP